MAISETAYLSLGSNLGDRCEQLRRACQALEASAIRLQSCSSIYETEPVDFAAQGWFLNCVVAVETVLSPLALLETLQGIEHKLGRRRRQPKGPRSIDLDILLYGNRTLNSKALVVPHPRMLERRFVMEPLREIAPSLRFPVSRETPVLQETVEELFQKLQDFSSVRRISSERLAGKARRLPR